MHSLDLTNNDQCEPFQDRSGVKQGYVINPTLFTIFIAIENDIIKDDLPPRIEIVYNKNGRLFNLAHLCSKTKTSASSLIQFQYADYNGQFASLHFAVGESYERAD